MRRALVFVTVVVATAAGSSFWLYDGDLAAAVAPVLSGAAAPEWNADVLAAREGIVDPPDEPEESPAEPAPTP